MDAKLVESFSRIKQDMQELQDQINDLKSENKILKDKINNLQNNEKDELQTEITAKLNRNKKNIIKQKIKEHFEIGMEIPEIKEKIVDQQKYCSKASFYRYLDELKKNGKIMEITVK